MPADFLPLALPEAGAFWNLRDDQGLGSLVPVPFGAQVEWVLDGDGQVWMGKMDLGRIPDTKPFFRRLPSLLRCPTVGATTASGTRTG